MDELVLEIKKLGEDLGAQIAKAEGQIVEAKGVSADTAKDLKAVQDKLNELEEKAHKAGKDIQDLAVKGNRELLPMGGGVGADHIKALEGQIFDQLKVAKEKGYLSEEATGRKVFKMEQGHLALHQKAVAGITTGNLTNGAGAAAYSARQISQNVINQPTPRTRVRSLLNTTPMTEALVEYPQFTGGEGAPGYQVNQGDTKAKLDYDWKMVPLQAKTIAATADVSRQSLADIGWLSSFLSTQMLNDLLKKEDTELLYGVGGANAINGLFNQSTDYVRTAPTYTTYYELLVDAAAQLEEKDYYVNGILLNPRDYANLLIYKSSTGEFNHPGLVFGGTNRDLLTFNGVPIYKSSAVTRLTGMVADWSNADLLIREGISFDISYENGTNFEKNMVTLRIEERIALAVYRPEAFMNIAFNTIAS